jgi:hypothetical protein
MATPQVVTITEDSIPHAIRKIKWDWACTDLGVVDSTTTKSYSGRVVRCVLASDAGGTAPDNLYDVTILDSDGYDVIHGSGADVTNAVTVQVTDATKLMWVKDSKLQLKIATAGNAKGGIVILYIEGYETAH